MRSIMVLNSKGGSGKSTVARRVADSLGYRFLDTGALYRGVTLLALRAGFDPGDEDALAGLSESFEPALRVTERGANPINSINERRPASLSERPIHGSHRVGHLRAGARADPGLMESPLAITWPGESALSC